MDTNTHKRTKRQQISCCAEVKDAGETAAALVAIKYLHKKPSHLSNLGFADTGGMFFILYQLHLHVLLILLTFDMLHINDFVGINTTFVAL